MLGGRTRPLWSQQPQQGPCAGKGRTHHTHTHIHVPPRGPLWLSLLASPQGPAHWSAPGAQGLCAVPTPTLCLPPVSSVGGVK